MLCTDNTRARYLINNVIQSFSFLLNILCHSPFPPLSQLLSFSSLQRQKEKSSPFESIEHLKGFQKGDKVKGIHELKKYPQKFGYLNYENSKVQSTHADADILMSSWNLPSKPASSILT
ncbi:hypothetical protein AB3S75_031780 [Citrus x aurantiifolia]